MHGDWKRLCVADDLKVGMGRQVQVCFANGRSHKVRVEDVEAGYLVTAVVAGWDVVGQMRDPWRDAWKRNRRSRLVGFRADKHGRLVAHGWTPKAGLTDEAFQHLVRAVAREADRYEFLLTGGDRR